MEKQDVQLQHRDVMLRVQAQVLPSFVLKDGGLQALVIRHVWHAQQENIRIKQDAFRTTNALDGARKEHLVLNLDSRQLPSAHPVLLVNGRLQLGSHPTVNV